MNIIAIPVFDTRISSRLDCSENVLVVSIDSGSIKRREIIRLLSSNPLEKVNDLIQLGVDVVICGGITDICLNKLKSSHINVIPWIRGDADEILNQFLNDMKGGENHDTR